MNAHGLWRKSAAFQGEILLLPVGVPDEVLPVCIEVLEEQLRVVTLADGREAAEDANILRPAPSPSLHSELGRQSGMSD